MKKQCESFACATDVVVVVVIVVAVDAVVVVVVVQVVMGSAVRGAIASSSE